MATKAFHNGFVFAWYHMKNSDVAANLMMKENDVVC
jgi:hypothetical protein